MPTDQCADEIDVVDHQIQNDSDVGTTRIEWRQSIALDKPRLVDVRQRGTNRAVEPLDMACLDQCTGPLRQRQQLVSFTERRRDRLLDE